MKGKIKNMNNKVKSILKIGIVLTLLLLISIIVYINNSFTILATLQKYNTYQAHAKESNEVQGEQLELKEEGQEQANYCYLSDIPYDKANSSVGWGSITLDSNLETQHNNGLITLLIDGEKKYFIKGISAHATSTLIYDISDYNYDFFTTYIGVDASRGSNGNGVKFAIYTSVDGSSWELHTPVSPPVMKGTSNAIFIKIDIREANYIKLYCNSNGNNTADHAVYADAKLTKEDYVEDNTPVEFIKTIEQYDEILIDKTIDEQIGTYELTLLQRTFVKNVGYDILQAFAKCNTDNANTIQWLMNDVENLRYYILGGTPSGSYINSLKELTRLLKEYKNDFEDTTEISNAGKEILQNQKSTESITKGKLYKKMAITLSLTHSARVGLWMQNSKENQSDSVIRYALYKKMYNEGKFKATDSVDITPWFETYSIEEMRWVLGTLIDDEEVIWLNEYTQSRIDKAPSSVWGLLTPHPYMAYVWPNYGNPVYYDENNKEYFNDLFAVETTDSEGNVHKKGLFEYIPYRNGTNPKVYKLWMNFRNKFGTGAVCGGISKSGHCIRGVNGIASAVIGQPGHAALLYYAKNSNGQGYWGIDNDVSGWAYSEKGERMLLGWGNDRTYVKGYNVPYIIMAQEALNDYENFVKAEEILMTVDVYKDNKEKQEQIYREAIKAQSINLDAWAGLAKLYMGDSTKTEADYYELEKEMMESLKCFPFPMYNLSNYIKTKITSDEYIFKYTILQTNILTEAKNYPNEGATVVQPSITRALASYLLGQIDTSLASFSFDGVDAGKIVLSSRFDGNGIRWDYSLDGKTTWNEVASTAANHKHTLTDEEIKSITSENDIYIHIVGTNYSEENIYKIDIQESAGLPTTIFANDLENRIVAVNLSIQWRYSESDKWTSYSVASPDLTGNKIVQLRQGATGTRLASTTPVTFTFTEDRQPDTRKYIPVSHLSIHSVSTQATNNGGAAINAIDANYNTRWHSAWNGTDTQRYIAIELDQPVNLSAVEFVPAGGGNGKIYDGTIYGSMNGTDWEELASLKNLTYTNQANTNEDAIKNTKSFEIKNPKEVKYVKIVANRTNGNWFTARAFNLYQDLTQRPHPTAGIAYSTTEPTNGIVVARLVNPSTNITITNNGGSDTYIFKENGEFTFEFKDENEITGSAKAKVNWIDKKGPTADVDYKLDEDKKLKILLDNISEDVYILDQDNKKINYVEVNEQTKKVTSVTYLDSVGNSYKVVELGENGETTKITYKNTTGKVTNVETYVTILGEDGTVESEEFYNSEGNSINVTDTSELEELRKLQQTTRSNPLEYAFEVSGDYEFRIQDKASNIAYKSIKVDYINNDSKILASDIKYNITKATNQDVVATIRPYIIDDNGNKDENVKIVSDGGTSHTFDENGTFTFEYMEKNGNTDNSDNEIKTHIAKVSWIDKIKPTAQIRYSTQEFTAGPVIATLVDESEEITIINNGTSREYTFTENDEFTFEFEDKAGNKGIATAKVDWIKKDEENPDKPIEPEEEKITSKKYRIEEKYIYEIPDKTTVTIFKENVETKQGMEFTDKSNQVLTDDKVIGTGTNLRVGEKLRYTLIVEGDLDGNGKITITDLTKMKLHVVKKQMLTGDYLKAADMNGNGEITITDLTQLKLRLVKKAEE